MSSGSWRKFSRKIRKTVGKYLTADEHCYLTKLQAECGVLGQKVQGSHSPPLTVDNCQLDKYISTSRQGLCVSEKQALVHAAVISFILKQMVGQGKSIMTFRHLFLSTCNEGSYPEDRYLPCR